MATSRTKPTVSSGKTKLRSPTKRKKRGKAADGPPTRLKLPSGQDVIVELEYPEDLTIDWRDSRGQQRPDQTKGKPLVCRGTRLRLQFPGGEVLEAVVKCAPEDNFERYTGKRDAFIEVCRQDTQRSLFGVSDDLARRVTFARSYLDKSLRQAGFDEAADEIKEILTDKLTTYSGRKKRNLLLPAEDRTALMKYLCPKFPQPGDTPTFTILKDQTAAQAAS